MGVKKEIVPVACDHAGFALKQAVLQALVAEGLVPRDLGTFSEDSVDYPEFARRVAGLIAQGDYRRGILICGTGLGMTMAANRLPGVRAALCVNPEFAELSRRHNDANILCLPGRFMDGPTAAAVVRRWLSTPFEGGRHERRVKQMDG